MNSTAEFLNSCYVADAINGEYVPFQLMPDEVGHSKSVNWQDQEVMGRAYPLKGYGNSSARSIALNLQFVRDMGIKFLTATAGEVKVVKVADWFMSFMYPSTVGLISPPHPVYVQIGQMIKMKGVIKDVNVSFLPPWYYPEEIGIICNVQCNIEEIGGVSPNMFNIREGNYLVGHDKATTRTGNGVGRLS